MQRLMAVLAFLALLAAACGDDSGSVLESPTTTAAATTTMAVPAPTTEAPTTTAPPPPTEAPTTAATAAPTSTTTAAPTTTLAASPAAKASGSGCAPGNVTTLPDGDWFGFIEGIDTTGNGSITFDLACHFRGAEADKAATEDAYPWMPLEFYPYVRNQNPLTFMIPMAAGAAVEDFLLGDFGFAAWVAAIPADFGCSSALNYYNCPVWVKIQAGEGVMLYDMLPEWAGDDRGS